MLLTAPATQLLQLFPSVIATKPCYDRIQKFLLSAKIDDPRRFQSDSGGLKYDNGYILQDRPLLHVTNLRLDVPFLCNGRPISFSMPPGTVWMVSGPVGSGKSTLLKSILGEINAKEGMIDLQSKFIGYCAQTPWLQNDSIKKNIIGRNLDDDTWYRHVIFRKIRFFSRVPLSLILTRKVTRNQKLKWSLFSRKSNFGISCRNLAASMHTWRQNHSPMENSSFWCLVEQSWKGELLVYKDPFWF